MDAWGWKRGCCCHVTNAANKDLWPIMETWTMAGCLVWLICIRSKPSAHKDWEDIFKIGHDVGLIKSQGITFDMCTLVSSDSNGSRHLMLYVEATTAKQPSHRGSLLQCVSHRSAHQLSRNVLMLDQLLTTRVSLLCIIWPTATAVKKCVSVHNQLT